MFLDPYFMQFLRPETLDKLSVNIDHVYYTTTFNFNLRSKQGIEKLHLEGTSYPSALSAECRLPPP